jgi:GTP cyclohydrolase I
MTVVEKGPFDVAYGIQIVLQALGVDIQDENFAETPERVAKMYAEMFQFQDKEKRDRELDKIFSKTFPTKYKGLVAEKNIITKSCCPHHLQPITYSIDIGYIANGNDFDKATAVGLSKIARTAIVHSKRAVLQEEVTQDIHDEFVNRLNPKGVIIIVRGQHGCMSNRGIQQDITTITSSISGIFENDIPARQEFLTLIK